MRVDGGPTGVLLCHGFTGSPRSLHLWSAAAVDAGFTVRVPLLPGHGTRWQDMNRTTFDDWLAAVTTSLAELAERCDTVVVGGLSMGGTLALRLAELHPGTVDGLVLVNPSVMSLRREMRILPLLKRVLPSVAAIGDDIAKEGVTEGAYPRTPLTALDSLRRGWATVRADLSEVRAPLLLLHSRTDNVVEPENSAIVLSGVSSTDVTEVWLEHSRHVATLDHDAALITASAVDFTRRISGVAVSGVTE
ncbi:alpha/beta fold hydrolase [Nakamurella sp. YIM 132087]|uniref:Alpha/beta fold hydrolase n=1 Tax=Nakamurella alba TaxID=2665158 RepID=A0A7K1FT89_9ACTN|nr:alpha/beta fold hydrolase [Nakamurella alba]